MVYFNNFSFLLFHVLKRDPFAVTHFALLMYTSVIRVGNLVKNVNPAPTISANWTHILPVYKTLASKESIGKNQDSVSRSLGYALI